MTYAHSDGAWRTFDLVLRDLIRARTLKSICEVGGGGNPALPVEFVEAHGLDYTIVDISSTELDRAPARYKKVVADICDESAIPGLGSFQLLLSKMLAEHIPDPEIFHRNCWRLLVKGGIALHFFPTLYALPFVANRLIPEGLASWILRVVDPRDRSRHPKFPAFYKWCRGPTRRQVARLQRLQFRVLEYRGFFGHGYYNRAPVLNRVAKQMADVLIRHPLPHLTSYACVILEKVA